MTLFLGCYVAALVPSMLTLGQLSDRIGRKAVLPGALATLAVAQAVLITEPDLPACWSPGPIQGLATGAFFGTCTAFLVDAAPPGRTPSSPCSARSRSASASASGRASAA